MRVRTYMRSWVCRLSVCANVCVRVMAVSQGRVDSPHTDSARGKRQPC